MFSCAAFVARTTSSRPPSRSTLGICCSVTDENDGQKETANTNKPQSRLARLAEDWLEEEEDELQMYWERFDKNKSTSNDQEDSPSQSSSSTNIHNEEDIDEDKSLTTEQRLERYYDRRGINKRREQEHTTEIQQAIKKAKKAGTTPEQAILYLQEVQPWLQINSKLGGNALLELAIALWQRDGIPDEATLILCEELLGNSHVRREVQLLLKNGPPKRQEESSLWQGFSFFDNNPNGWWN